MLSRDEEALTEQRKPCSEILNDELFDRLPARILMERLSIPIAAVSDDGRVLVSNQAFAELLGRSLEEIASTACSDIFDDLPGDAAVLAFVRAHAERAVALRHIEGVIMHAIMTRSVLVRDTETVTVVAFTDVSELHWTHGGLPPNRDAVTTREPTLSATMRISLNYRLGMGAASGGGPSLPPSNGLSYGKHFGRFSRPLTQGTTCSS